MKLIIEEKVTSVEVEQTNQVILTIADFGVQHLAIEKSIIDAKGDLVVGTAADTPERFPVGDPATTLTADPSAAHGMKWVSAGWTPSYVTWTYASPTTFTVSGDLTGIFRKGTRVKLTQAMVKYFYVLSSSYGAPNTTVTITGGSNYSLADAPINTPEYSYSENPAGFPDWFSWTPVYTGFSVDPTLICRFSIKARVVFCNVRVSSAGTSNATTFTMTAPVACAADGQFPLARPIDNGVISATGLVFMNNGSDLFTLYKSAMTAWTASGDKSAAFSLFYQT